MLKKFTFTKTEISSPLIIAGIFFILLLPYIILAFFNWPAADDFCFMSNANNSGFFRSVIDSYSDWTGRYFSTALIAIFPSILKAKIAPLLIIAALAFSFYIFSKRFFNFNNKESLAISLAFSFSYLTFLPSITESLYWISGGLSYQLAAAMVFLIVALIFNYDLKAKPWLVVSIIALVGAAVGSNETTLAFLTVFLGLLAVYCLYYKKPSWKQIMIIFLADLIFSAIVFLAPGNTVRSEMLEGVRDFSFSLDSAFYFTVFLAPKLLNPVLILGLVIFLAYKPAKADKPKHETLAIHPFWMFWMLFASFFSMIFAFYYAAGNDYAFPGRIVGFAFSIIFLSLLLAAYYIRRYLLVSGRFTPLNNTLKALLMLAIYLLLSSNGSYNWGVACDDVVSGRAYGFNKSLKERLKLFPVNTGKDLEIEAVKVQRPHSFYDNDIAADSADWKNECYANYFNLKSIHTKSLNPILKSDK